MHAPTLLGRVRSSTAADKVQGSLVDGVQPEAQEEVSYCSSCMAQRWCVTQLHAKAIDTDCWTAASRLLDFLQERLLRETTDPSFSEMPFRFAEIAKILLDV